MDFDRQHCIMSLSYERDAKEQIEIGRTATARWLTSRNGSPGKYALLWYIAYIVLFGLLMELYRRYVLTYIADLSSIPPFSIAMLQALPVFALIWLLIVIQKRLAAKRREEALEAGMAGKRLVSFEIYPEGIRSTIGEMMFQSCWTTIRDIVISKRCIYFDYGTWVFYLPSRAFEGHEDYTKRAREIVALWKGAVEARAAVADAVGP